MAYRYPRGWGQQKPPVGAVLDRGDPINNGAFLTYLFNEAGGMYARDIAGGADVAFSSSANFVWTPGNHGIAAGRGAADEWAVSTKTPQITTGNVSCSAWVYPTSSTSDWIMSQGPVNTKWMLFLESGNIRFRTVTAGNNVSAAAPTLNQWCHIVGTMNGLDGKIYLNGVLTGSGTVSFPLPNVADLVYVGAYDAAGGSYNFNGKFGQLRAWNRALTATEVLRLYSEPFAGIYKPRQYWSRAGAAAGGPIISSQMVKQYYVMP